MNNIPAILIANGSAVVLLTIVLLSARKTVHVSLFDHKLFLVMLFCAMTQSVMELASFLVDGQAGLNWLNCALNSFLFANNIAFAFTWTVYVDYKLFSDIGRLKRIYGFVAIPAFLVVVGAIVNLFTPVFFTITADNVYQRGGPYILPFVLTYIYIIYGVLLVYINMKKVKRYLFMPVVIFVIPIVIGSLLQFFFYGYSLVWIGAAIGLTSIYINVQNEVSLIDQLTGLFTRQYLMRYLNSQLKNGETGKTMVGIMLDIDRFKHINDTFGHLIGDEALTTAGYIIRSCVPSKAVAARYAGDEFIVLLPNENSQAAEELLLSIDTMAESENSSGDNPYTLCFSAGHSELCSGDTVESFLERMDKAMYKNKNAKNAIMLLSSDNDSKITR